MQADIQRIGDLILPCLVRQNFRWELTFTINTDIHLGCVGANGSGYERGGVRSFKGIHRDRWGRCINTYNSRISGRIADWVCGNDPCLMISIKEWSQGIFRQEPCPVPSICRRIFSVVVVVDNHGNSRCRIVHSSAQLGTAIAHSHTFDRHIRRRCVNGQHSERGISIARGISRDHRQWMIPIR